METIRQLDLQLFHFVNQRFSNDVFDVICPLIRDKTFMIACYFVFAAIMYRAFPDQFLKIVIGGAITFLLTDQISATLIKPIFHRLRPCNNSAVNARLLADYCGSGFSFVSSHATNSFGMVAFLSIVRAKRRTSIILIIWALLVCYSQVYVGVHYPFDVLSGGITGAVIGSTTGTITRKFMTNHT